MSNWNQWGPWDTCSVSCAVSGKGGTQKRTRTCDNKAFNSFGAVVPCLPSQILNEDIQPCNTEICRKYAIYRMKNARTLLRFT